MFDVHPSVSIERQGWKAPFRTAPAPSRFSPTNSHYTGFKSGTRQAENQRFPLIPLYHHYIRSNNIEKSSIRSYKDAYAAGFSCAGLQPSRCLLLSDWMIVSHHHLLQVFRGSTGRNDIVKHNLEEVVIASFVRFQPIDFFGHKALRVELYGALKSLGTTKTTDLWNG